MHTVSYADDERGRREWIKASLAARKCTLGSLARELGLSRGAVQKALWQPYPRMEQAIAERLGMKPEDIWPERYERRAARRGSGGLGRTHADKASTGEGGAH